MMAGRPLAPQLRVVFGRLVVPMVLTVAGCGALRVAPEPAFTEPISIQIRDLHVEDDVLVGVLALSNDSRGALEVAGVDWSASPLGVVSEGGALRGKLPPNGELQLALTAPIGAGWSGELPATVRILGTVYIRGAVAGRRARTFGVTAPLAAGVP
jgi:hypothetical protein